MNKAIDRRHFIRLGVGALGVSASAGCARAPEPADAMDAHAVLTAILMRMFPHENLDSTVYEETARIVEARLSAQPQWPAAFRAGVAVLDAAAGGDWLSESPDAQITHLSSVSDQPFFRMLYVVALTEFYSNPKVWARVGYEGPSAEFGGYLNRGFDDIDWLPGAGG